MYKLVKIVNASAGCQVRKRRSDGTTRNRVVSWWGVWRTDKPPVERLRFVSGPCSNCDTATPEIVRHGFVEFVIPNGLPVDLFM